ncbi:MAG: hypothetical protein AABP62_29055 [Planctomycetota bacterium]
MNQLDLLSPVRELTLRDRRAFLRLPLEERRRKMAEQADACADHYEQPRESSERLTWQGGDFADSPSH